MTDSISGQRGAYQVAYLIQKENIITFFYSLAAPICVGMYGQVACLLFFLH